ncbi:MAG: hypothetical protein H6718_06570 [Polyangiaceae bacterium]|nr:hypothetical protein [Polyangiaceae bacterium]MCB9610066.1 hypothetical protein [Polyangiaceae bacterium]
MDDSTTDPSDEYVLPPGVAEWFVPGLASQRWIVPTLVGIHAIECFAFLPLLRKTARDGNADLPMLLIFGAVH